MKYNQKKYEYNNKYIRENLKHVSVYMRFKKYDRVRETSKQFNESMNVFINTAIDQRLQRIEDGVEVPEDTRDD